MKDNYPKEIPIHPLVRELLAELERPGDAPGAVAAAGVVAAMAAALGRAANPQAKTASDLARVIAEILQEVDLDTIAYRNWTAGMTSDTGYVDTPSRVSCIASAVDALLANEHGPSVNFVDIAAARVLARAALTALDLISDGNRRNQSPYRLVQEAVARTPRVQSKCKEVVSARTVKVWLPGNTASAAPLLHARSARGCWIEDEEGQQWFDATSGMWNVPLGHGRPEVLQAFYEQSLQLAAIDPFQVSSGVADLAAETLCRYVGWPTGRVFFSSSGSEAIETALRIGLMVCGPEVPVSVLPGAFHGCTAGAAILSGYCQVHEPYSKKFRSATTALPRAWAAGGLGFVEAYQGAGGGQVLDNIDRAALARFQSSGGILVADEVACGLGRCAAPVAAIALGLVPDIVVFGKGLANGVAPVSAVLLSERVVDMLGNSSLEDGHTHSNHPPSLASAIATLEIMEAECTHEAAALLEHRLRNQLGRHGVKLLGVGALLALPLGRSISRNQVFDALRSTHTVVHVPTSTQSHDRLIIAPPLTLNSDEIEELACRLVALKKHCAR